MDPAALLLLLHFCFRCCESVVCPSLYREQLPTNHKNGQQVHQRYFRPSCKANKGSSRAKAVQPATWKRHFTAFTGWASHDPINICFKRQQLSFETLALGSSHPYRNAQFSWQLLQTGLALETLWLIHNLCCAHLVSLGWIVTVNLFMLFYGMQSLRILGKR